MEERIKKLEKLIAFLLEHGIRPQKITQEQLEELEAFIKENKTNE